MNSKLELKNKMSELILKLDKFNGDHILICKNDSCESTYKSVKRKINFINKKMFK